MRLQTLHLVRAPDEKHDYAISSRTSGEMGKRERPESHPAEEKRGRERETICRSDAYEQSEAEEKREKIRRGEEERRGRIFFSSIFCLSFLWKKSFCSFPRNVSEVAGVL